MLRTIDTTWTKGTYISFRNVGHIAKRTTLTWEVHNQGILGHVEWFSRWRKYCFAPVGGTVYEETCLREIAEFCVAATKEHKGVKAQ